MCSRATAGLAFLVHVLCRIKAYGPLSTESATSNANTRVEESLLLTSMSILCMVSCIRFQRMILSRLQLKVLEEESKRMSLLLTLRIASFFYFDCLSYNRQIYFLLFLVYCIKKKDYNVSTAAIITSIILSVGVTKILCSLVIEKSSKAES